MPEFGGGGGGGTQIRPQGPLAGVQSHHPRRYGVDTFIEIHFDKRRDNFVPGRGRIVSVPCPIRGLFFCNKPPSHLWPTLPTHLTVMVRRLIDTQPYAAERRYKKRPAEAAARRHCIHARAQPHLEKSIAKAHWNSLYVCTSLGKICPINATPAQQNKIRKNGGKMEEGERNVLSITNITSTRGITVKLSHRSAAAPFSWSRYNFHCTAHEGFDRNNLYNSTVVVAMVVVNTSTKNKHEGSPKARCGCCNSYIGMTSLDRAHPKHSCLFTPNSEDLNT